MSENTEHEPSLSQTDPGDWTWRELLAEYKQVIAERDEWKADAENLADMVGACVELGAPGRVGRALMAERLAAHDRLVAESGDK